MDENTGGLTDTNADDLRKRVLYDVYFSGGNIEWYAGYHDLPLGGDMRMEDFSTRETMWTYMAHARRFLQIYVPFWQMSPNDELLTGEAGDYGGGEVFAKAGDTYAVYLPAANPSGTLDLSGASPSDDFETRWYNPRTGQFQGTVGAVTGGSPIELGTPPGDPAADWVILIRKPREYYYLPLVR